MMKLQDFFIKIAGGIMVIAFLAFAPSGAFASAPYGKPAAHRESPRAEQVGKILPVLKEKVGDGKMLEKFREKLSLMDDGEVRLVGELCGKVSHERQGLGSDIAFLLATALIVLS